MTDSESREGTNPCVRCGKPTEIGDRAVDSDGTTYHRQCAPWRQEVVDLDDHRPRGDGGGAA